MKKVFILILILSTTLLFSVSMNEYLNRDSLPRTLEEGDFSTIIDPEEKKGYGVFEFKPFWWKDIQWKNHILIIEPTNLESSTSLIFITDDYKIDPELLPIFKMMALRNRAYVTVLFDVPNQPLFNGRREDWLIAHTLDKCLECSDYEWPILLPMVKSVMVAMNMIHDYAKIKNHTISGFILSGGSKRGWTAWLTAAFDNRVKAIAPIVFDNLNIKAQMEHQISFWGNYSKSISEYVETGVLSDLEKKEKLDLLTFIDPYTYLEDLSIPKLIISGTNDPYWPIDAATLYFHDLPGEKGIVYSPNVPHDADIPRTLQAIDSLFAIVDKSECLPKIDMSYKIKEKSVIVSTDIIEQDWEIHEKRLFSASSEKKDFRNAHFSFLQFDTDSIEIKTEENTAIYVEVVFKKGTRELTLSSPASVIIDSK